MTNSHIECHRVVMPLLRPHRAAHGTTTTREVLLLRLRTDAGDGWGECSALAAPTYTSEYLDGCEMVLRDVLIPLLASVDSAAATVAAMSSVRGHHMAKAAVEMAFLDVDAQRAGTSLAAFLGATARHVPWCAVVDPGDDLSAVSALAGLRRLKFKVTPATVQQVIATSADLRDHPDVDLGVDANGSLAGQPAVSHRLIEAGISLVEQPDAPDALGAHAELVRSGVPVALDESIDSVGDVAIAAAMAACVAINIKPARLGGILPALAAARSAGEQGLGCFVGGMLETGVGRAAALAVAAAAMSLCPATQPTDVGPSERYFADDVCEPLVSNNEGMVVPQGLGLGIAVRDEVIASRSVRSWTAPLGASS